MNSTTIRAFDSTLQTTNIWLNDLADQLGWQDMHRVYHALSVVLHALRDRLPISQVAALGAQLPMLVRGIYFEGWHPIDKPIKERKKEEFLAHIEKAFGNIWATDAEEVVQAVFRVIAKHVSPGEIKHVKVTLPEEIRSMWSQQNQTLWF